MTPERTDAFFQLCFSPEQVQRILFLMQNQFFQPRDFTKALDSHYSLNLLEV